MEINYNQSSGKTNATQRKSMVKENDMIERGMKEGGDKSD